MAFILVLAMVMGFAGCGNDDSNNGGGNPPPSEPETPASDFIYGYDAAALGVIIREYIGSGLKVRIPERIEGEPVAGIGENAFKDSGIMSVYIPDTVKSIGDFAFQNCKGLTEITIPESVTSIGKSLFVGCTALTSVVMGESLRKGMLIRFGGDFYRVLTVEGDKALIISEDVIERREFNSDIDKGNDWATSDIRSYLNDEFYDSAFSSEEKARINESEDKIFLLSREEAEQYFADGSARIAYDKNGEACWWWLRSPGYFSLFAARVRIHGFIYGSCNVDNEGGVRPALWLNL